MVYIIFVSYKFSQFILIVSNNCVYNVEILFWCGAVEKGKLFWMFNAGFD